MDMSNDKLDQVVAQMRTEFIEGTRDRLDDIEAMVFSESETGEAKIVPLYRDVHNLKGQGTMHGFPSVTLIAERLEDYLSGLTEIGDGNARDVGKFLDAMRGIVESEKDLGDEALRDVLRSLPTHHRRDFEVDAPLDVEVLLVTPANAVGRAVARELRECGYRVSTVESPWSALQLAACTKPDLIITSVVMDGIGGIDLSRAVAAISTTKDVPVAVLTSFDRGHPELTGLSDAVPVVRVGGQLRDDLGNALTQIGIA